MLESISLFEQLFLYVNQTIKGEAPLWVYFILALIPICILVAVRESFCWFFKVNRISRRLDRLDKRMMVLNGSVEEIVMILKQEIQKSKIRAGNIPSHHQRKDRTTTPLEETELPLEEPSEKEDFTLEERPWSEK
jgi:hypothetical protein